MDPTQPAPDAPEERDRIALHSPRAIGVGAFLGGPLAAGILAALNFHRLGRKRAGHLALAIGALTAVVLLGGLFALPSEISDRIPNSLLPALYVSIAFFWVQKTQGEQIAAALASGAARKASGWSVAGIGAGCLVVTLGVMVPFVLAMPPFDFTGERVTYGPDGMHEIYVEGDVDRASVDALFATLEAAGVVGSEVGIPFQIERIDDRYELSMPIGRGYWDDAELLLELAGIRDQLSTSVFKAAVTMVLVDEDLRRTHRKALELDAVALYERACEAGAASACYDLAVMYDVGDGAALDDARAAALYERACDEGEMAGCFNLGVMYQQGEGVAQEAARAAALYERACDGGQITGCYNLGVMREQGEGVVQEAARAAALYERACDGGEMGGCVNLGVLCEQGEGVAQDAARAVALYQRACDGGMATGCYNLGRVYEHGVGVAQDAARAVAPYQRACDGGDATGCLDLGVMYDEGTGVAQDTARAAALYQQACDGGEMIGCHNLAAMYVQGEGVAQDLPKAVALYKRACAAGHAPSCLEDEE